MTEPQPYPGDLPTEQRPVQTGPFSRAFRDSIDRPMTGYVVFRPELDGAAVAVPVEDGVVTVPLAAGHYRMVANLVTADGRPTYQTDYITVEASP